MSIIKIFSDGSAKGKSTFQGMGCVIQQEGAEAVRLFSHSVAIVKSKYLPQNTEVCAATFAAKSLSQITDHLDLKSVEQIQFFTDNHFVHNTLTRIFAGTYRTEKSEGHLYVTSLQDAFSEMLLPLGEHDPGKIKLIHDHRKTELMPLADKLANDARKYGVHCHGNLLAMPQLKTFLTTPYVTTTHNPA